MFRGVKKSTGWVAILGVGSLLLVGSVPAKAQMYDADLEERIAELEATTARKGNRKVKVILYGKVNEAVMFWNDGEEQNAYVVTNDSSRTRFGVKGGAKISDDLSANFRIEVGMRGANSKRSNQIDPDGTGGNRFDVRHSWWNLKSKTLGTIQVGHTPTASQEVTEANLAGTSEVGKYSDVEDSGGGFFLRAKDFAGNGLSNVQWRRLIKRNGSPPGEGDRREAVYYISPTFAHFSVSAGWGADDSWDVGLKYKNTFGTVKVLAKVAYGQNTDTEDDAAFFVCPAENVLGPASGADCQAVGGSVSILDTKSGLYGSFAAGWEKDNTVALEPNFAGTNVGNTYRFWATELGIQKKWFPLGSTTLFGQYYHYEGGGITQTIAGGSPISPFATDGDIFSSEVESFGLGAMQKIDAAAMKLYVLYRHYDFEMEIASGGAVANSAPLDDFQVIMSGAVIHF